MCACVCEFLLGYFLKAAISIATIVVVVVVLYTTIVTWRLQLNYIYLIQWKKWEEKANKKIEE